MTSNTQMQCQECGCLCESCHANNSLHLHKEIEDLKDQVLQREYHILQMDSNMSAMAMAAADKYPNGEYAALSDEMQLCQDKYERLLESHRKLQRVNQGLEDKLLKIVDKYETEKTELNRDLANVTSRLVDTRVSLIHIEEENEQNKSDCNIAIQLLQCKPSNFVAHKLDSFPMELQQKAKVHLSTRKIKLSKDQQGGFVPEARTIRVPIPTFPPTAMVYSVNNEELLASSMSAAQSPSNNSSDIVSAAIMAKVLEERAKERNSCCTMNSKKHGKWSCKCSKNQGLAYESVGTQTQWTILPNASIASGRTFQDVTSQNCSDCRTVLGAFPTFTAGVHSPPHSWPTEVDTLNGRRWQMRSGSSTSTETEI